MTPSAVPSPDPSRRRGLGFSLQLFILLVVPLGLLALAVPFASFNLHAHAMRELVGERDRRAASAAATGLRERLEHRAATVRGLALYATLAPNPQAALSAYAFQQPAFEGGLALYSRGGAFLAATGDAGAWTARPVASLIASAAGAAQPRFSDAFREGGSGGWLILVAATAPDPAGPVAVGALSPATLGQWAAADLVGPGTDAGLWIVDSNRQVLFQAGHLNPEVDLAEHAGVAEALRGEAGSTYLPVAGTEHVVAFSPVTPTGWALVVEEPWEAVDNPLLRRTQLAPLILVPVLAFALLLVGLGLRHVVQPLRALALRSAELARGRYDAIEQPVGGIREIRHLQSELANMARQVQAAQHSLRTFASDVTRGQEDERRRLARELHDQTVQSLIALDQRVQLAQRTARQAAPEIEPRLAELRPLIASLLDEVRRVIRGLRPIYLEDLGLLPALEMLTRDLEQSGPLQATFSTQGQPARLAPEREIAVYRVAQEALSNVARHAQARHVHVSAQFGVEAVVLRVQDDGQGFSVPEQTADRASSGHFGLVGMRERAKLAGGHLRLHSTSGGGTTVELHLPLDSHPPLA
jgi:two-component system sensor histidine kinase UhpB